MPNKTNRRELFTGDECVVCIGRTAHAGKVTGDTKQTLIVRFSESGTLTQRTFNRGSGYERNNTNFAHLTPIVYAPDQWVSDRRCDARNLLKEDQT